VSHACIYSIVRFAPFAEAEAEAEEFANIGIALSAPAIRRMSCPASKLSTLYGL
jgi:hypothetical protein